MKLALLTRRGCHLCDQMAAVLDSLLPARGLGYEVIDVDRDTELQRRFGEAVPVLLRDGLPVAKVRISSRQLERILRRRR